MGHQPGHVLEATQMSPFYYSRTLILILIHFNWDNNININIGLWICLFVRQLTSKHCWEFTSSPSSDWLDSSSTDTAPSETRWEHNVTMLWCCVKWADFATLWCEVPQQFWFPQQPATVVLCVYICMSMHILNVCVCMCACVYVSIGWYNQTGTDTLHVLNMWRTCDVGYMNIQSHLEKQLVAEITMWYEQVF